MDKVAEIEAAIASLPPEEFRRLAAWLHNLEQVRWEQQIDQDSANGHLDALFDEANHEVRTGLATDWPPR